MLDLPTPAELDAMERLCNAASEPPWTFVEGKIRPELHGCGDKLADGFIGTVPYHQDCGDPECDCYEIYVQRDKDFEFISAARTDVPRLIAAARQAVEMKAGLLARLKHYFVSPQEPEADDTHRERCEMCGKNIRSELHCRVDDKPSLIWLHSSSEARELLKLIGEG